MSFRFHLITNAKSLYGLDYAKEYPNSLVLAQLCSDPLYVQEIKRKMKAGHRIILDNGAHEGIDIDLKEYQKIVMDLKPSVVVLTDLVGRSYQQSRDQSFKFVKMIDMDLLPDTKFMYVPQGQTKEQVLYEYQWALDNLDPNDYIIGLGQGYLCWVDEKHDVNAESTRMPMVEAVMTMTDSYDHEFHVLGARWSADGSAYHIYDEITGIDTIKPCTCAYYNTTYPNRPTGNIRSIDRLHGSCVDEELLIQNVTAFCDEYGCEDESDIGDEVDDALDEGIVDVTVMKVVDEDDKELEDEVEEEDLDDLDDYEDIEEIDDEDEDGGYKVEKQKS